MLTAESKSISYHECLLSFEAPNSIETQFLKLNTERGWVKEGAKKLQKQSRDTPRRHKVQKLYSPASGVSLLILQAPYGAGQTAVFSKLARLICRMGSVMSRTKECQDELLIKTSKVAKQC